ncbi:hypothetical protein AC579_8699 [Lecanosticta acicola]|uniref:BHLH domain-containing protein n=1 Tax=Lecanosticta acicola TaxID=111012 RepID=A0AAI8Z060_9PEZI|nr:hypothetical protein AC579_8699 [Lecanosticta acicola]
MAAAAASYQQSQLPGGHLGPGMDNTFHGGQQQSAMNFGDNSLFAFDNSDLSSLSVDSNQQPILNQNDNHYLSTFFDNPSIITNEFNPFDFSPSAEQRPTANGNPSLFAGAFFDYNSGTINPNTPGAYQRNSSQPNAAALSADDYTAASTIHSLKATSSSSFQANPNGLGGASWGAFMMPQQMPLNISMGNAPLVGANGQAPPQFFAHPQNMSIAPGTFPFQQQQQRSHAQNGNSRNQQVRPQFNSHHSFTASSSYQGQNRPQQPQNPQFQGQQQQATPPSQGGRPPLYQFGSDQGFDGNRYSNSSAAPQPDGKANNLLGVPGAVQAARTPYQNGQLLPPQQQAAQWAEMARRNGAQFPDAHDHKRRKSGEGQSSTPRAMHGDIGYDTFADGSAKRRRSSLTRHPSELPGSPLLQEQDRSLLRNKRETLSDAQKRDNHIQSEKKRRNIINQGYEDLNRLVPCLASGKSGLSRSECLQEIACYLESLIRGADSAMNWLKVSRQELGSYNPRPAPPPPPPFGHPPQPQIQRPLLPPSAQTPRPAPQQAQYPAPQAQQPPEQQVPRPPPQSQQQAPQQVHEPASQPQQPGTEQVQNTSQQTQGAQAPPQTPGPVFKSEGNGLPPSE